MIAFKAISSCGHSSGSGNFLCSKEIRKPESLATPRNFLLELRIFTSSQEDRKFLFSMNDVPSHELLRNSA